MPQYTNITGEDTIRDTIKVTKGFFTGDTGTIAGSALTTASLSSGQNEYYHNLQYSSEDQFSVSYGHKGGSGSNDTIGQTKAIYKQFASMLLPDSDVEGGFAVNDVSQSDMYFIVAERARMKDRINRKNWTIQLSGSDVTLSAGHSAGSAGGSGSLISLTDNSVNTASVATPAGPRYDVISGSNGTQAANEFKRFGYFYPRLGIWALSQQQLSSSLPGTRGYIDSGSPVLTDSVGVGFARDESTDGTADNAGKLVNSIVLGGSLTMRNEEDQTSVAYFCRAKARDYNFSNNPTFASGSDSVFRIPSFEGNPQTFITTVGLFNSNNMLIAVGRLSSPVHKNYQTEATIKVNLTY